MRGLHSKDELISASAEVGRLIADYEVVAHDNTQLRAELGRWETEFRIPERTGYRPEPARVARRDQSGWWPTATTVSPRPLTACRMPSAPWLSM